MVDYPLVSIITGYYNRKENLLESVQSVLEQTYENFEYIIFDDCSTDGTSELLASFNDRRLRLVSHTKNIGFTKGIIAAIGESNGELIAIHGAGDISFRDRISKQVEFLKKNANVAIVGCLLEDVSNEGIYIHSPENQSSKNHFTQGEVMYRKSLYYQTGGYNPIFKFGQFTNLKHELLKLGEAGFVNEILYRRIHYDNGVTKNPKKRVEQRAYMRIGQELATTQNLLYVDLPLIIIKVCLEDIDMVMGTQQEDLLKFHLKKRNFIAYQFFVLYKRGLIGESLLKKILYKTIY